MAGNDNTLIERIVEINGDLDYICVTFNGQIVWSYACGHVYLKIMMS